MPKHRVFDSSCEFRIGGKCKIVEIKRKEMRLKVGIDRCVLVNSALEMYVIAASVADDA